VQHLRALMLLADLRLVQGEAEFLTNDRWEPRQADERVDKSNQLSRLFRLFQHSFYCMPELV
jgi:hypothetical protein